MGRREAARFLIRSRRIPTLRKPRKGGAPDIRLLKHDLLQQFRTDDFAYLLALLCDLLRLLFATHDLVTHRLALCGQAVHGSVILWTASARSQSCGPLFVSLRKIL